MCVEYRMISCMVKSNRLTSQFICVLLLKAFFLQDGKHLKLFKEIILINVNQNSPNKDTILHTIMPQVK